MQTHIRALYKKIVLISLLGLLAAGCSPLGSTPSGAGVAKTTNAGSDWIFMNKAKSDSNSKKKKAKPADSLLAGANVIAIKFSPDDAKQVYAATQGQGLFYSEDGAESWTQILPAFNAFDVAIDPTNKDHIYVAGQVEGQARVLATVNHGKSWDVVYNDAASGNAARTIAFDPADVKTIVVGLNSGNLIRTQDGGATWTLLQNFSSPISQMFWHKDRTLFILARTKGLYVSQDGGQVVTNISQSLMDGSAWKPAVSSSQQGYDPTQVAQVEVPTNQTNAFYKVSVGGSSQRVYIAADNGLFETTNQGATWRYFKLPLRAGRQPNVRGLALADNDKLLYAGVANTIFKSVNNGESWQVTAIATQATINYILVDPQYPQIAYSGFIGSQQQ